MTTSFSSLPFVDLSVLSQASSSRCDLAALSNELHNVFATTGFAYLVNAPLSFSHEDVFDLAKRFFSMRATEKMALAKKTVVRGNKNTYRGYFPPQSGQMDNLKEGFELGPRHIPSQTSLGWHQRLHLTEPNVWPDEASFLHGRVRLERLHAELQTLSSTLLSLLAVSLGKPADYFSSYLVDPLSTLRLLHYPPQAPPIASKKGEVKLCCTPHTDSGILTLLHQDQTGGLEVLNANGEWIAAPYVPGAIVVNIGDLMAEVSGGLFVATLHRVRTNSGGVQRADGMGRFSVPFFFEPGEACMVRNVDGGEGVVYGEHVRRKLGGWVEFQDASERKMDDLTACNVALKVF